MTRSDVMAPLLIRNALTTTGCQAAAGRATKGEGAEEERREGRHGGRRRRCGVHWLEPCGTPHTIT